jgi:4,5-dihydroxyphthalate decarboxylase
MTIELSLSSYVGDIVRPLMTGEVSPEGIDLTTIVEYPPKRHRRFFRHQEFDICEVSLASYLSSRTDPEANPFTAIPVFPEKKFRHSFLFKNADSDVTDPADLAGRKVGIQSWETTANVWIRGILAEHYGLDLEAVQWYRRKEDDVGADIPDRFDISSIAGEQGGDAVEEPRDIREALFDGDLVAAMDPAGEMFNAVVDSEEAELFFEDPIAEEQAYYEETGIHPPMHVVAIRDEVLEANPWVAVNVFDAFVEARDRCFERNRSPTANTSLTWSHLHFADQRETLGPHAWEYGLTDRTHKELETFVRYAHEQGLIPRRYDPEELFVDSTLDL